MQLKSTSGQRLFGAFRLGDELNAKFSRKMFDGKMFAREVEIRCNRLNIKAYRTDKLIKARVFWRPHATDYR